MGVHHGFDKIQNVDGFSANVVAKFFGFLPGPPAFWTLSAAATQIAGSAALAVGVLSRPVAASMAATMAAAVTFHLLNTGPEGFPLAIVKAHSYNFELAAMYVIVLGYFTVAGGVPSGYRQGALVQLRARCHVRHRPWLLHRRRCRAVVCRRAGAWRRDQLLQEGARWVRRGVNAELSPSVTSYAGRLRCGHRASVVVSITSQFDT